MPKILVIADDLTGANDTGALLNQLGLNTVSSPCAQIEASYYEGRDALCINADSRAMTSKTAYDMVRKIAECYREPDMLISKRIDSTLRGNIGSEIDGVLDALPDEYKAIVVAAAPGAGRICAGGYIMVHSVPLELSGTGKDPKTPVYSSQVSAIIKEQSTNLVGQVFLKDVLKGTEHLSQVLNECSERIIVVDGVTDENIETIARACNQLNEPIVCIDPGIFTCKMAQCRYQADLKKSSKRLLLAGSLSETTKKQLEYYISKNKTLVFNIDMRRLLENQEAEQQRAIEYFTKNGEQYESFCITSVFSERMVCQEERKDDIQTAEIISKRMAEIGVEILKMASVKIAFLCGGDIAKDFIEKTGAKAIDIFREVIPLAVYGRLLGGAYDGLEILTKGGMIGQETDLDFMLNKL